MFGPTASNSLDVCGALVATCLGNAELLKLNPRRRRETSSSVITRLQACERRTTNEMNTTRSQGILREVSHLTRAALRSRTASRHATPATTGTTDRCSNICHNRKFRKPVCYYRVSVRLTLNDMIKVAIVVKQIMRELSKAGSEKDKIMIITKMVLNLMKQNGC
jgi:hypothetical protein